MLAVTVLPAVLLGVLATLLPDGAGLLTVLVTVAIILVLAPTLFASFYVSYRDVFVTSESVDA